MDAISKMERLIMSEPVQKGLITDMAMIEKILKEQIFMKELRIDTEEHKMLISEPPLNPKKNREDLVTLMFEEFKVPRLYLGNQSVMSLFALGRTTGTVLDIGEGITHAVPIYEGYAIPHAIQTVPLCGRDITDFLHKMLMENAPELISESYEDKEEKVKKIKEKMCYMALDFDAELKGAQENSNIEKTYMLPGEKPLKLKEELIRAPELLFAPQYKQEFVNKPPEPIQRWTYDAIFKCHADIKKDLFKNIVLAGGSTMFPGMKDRMRKEIQALAPSPMSPDVEAPADRKYSCWLGGAYLSLIEKFDPIWITDKEFNEFGASIVHRKCF